MNYSRSLKLSRPALIAALFLSLTACGNKNRIITFDNDPNSHIPTDNLTQSQRAALKTFVYCQDANCNPSVAMLVSTENRGIGACTASLIAPDIAVTNSHCIPKDLKADGSDCSSRIYLFFPDIGNLLAERSECSEVLRASVIGESETGKSNGAPDYAFIRLKAPASRKLLQISNDGFTQGAIYHLAKVNPQAQNGFFSGALKNTTCHSVYPTAIAPTSSDESSPVTSFSDCDIMHGNSGSPILDERGQIHGVIQALFEPNDPSRVAQNNYLDGIPNHMAVGTNLGCIELPGVLPPHALSPACSVENTPEVLEAMKKKRSAEIVAKVTKLAIDSSRDSIPSSANDIFEWTIASRKKDSFSTETWTLLVPKCFKPATKWIQKYQGRITSVESSASIDIDIPYWKVEIGLNDHLQFDARLDPYLHGRYRSKLKFSPKSFQSTGQSTVTLIDQNSGVFSSGSKYMDETLGACL